ncbi:MAG TPA: methyltransferase domain-containing protein, partial [Desulfobacterales bacterium]|nr:methyltransferase domain-containing protein [Desulfobacterales bacterium]
MLSIGDIESAYLNTRRRLRQLRRMSIRPADVVLDVGSGGTPNWRANVLCDKFVVDATERGGNPFYVGPGQYGVIGDAMRLPFRELCFDYVICSHILEHMEDPGAFLREI